MSVTTAERPPASKPPAVQGPRRVGGGLLDPKQLLKSTPDALRKLNPATLWRNPVMFIVEIGSLVTTAIWIRELIGQTGHPLFSGQIAFWLWFTVLFANFAEAIAEGRGKAQAATLRKARTELEAAIRRFSSDRGRP